MTAQPVEVRPAASTLLLRSGGQGVEVLLVLRPPRGFFGGLMVFPGGAVDPEDDTDLAREVVPGEHDDHVCRIAALRELAEETGIALTEHGLEPAPAAAGKDLFLALREMGTILDGSALTLVSRWVTPQFAPKRFDTRFYLARAEGAPEVVLDRAELVDHAWVTPSDALDHQEQGEWEMFLPTIAHLRWLARRTDVDDAVASASGADGRSLIQPRLMDDGSMVPTLVPVDD